MKIFRKRVCQVILVVLEEEHLQKVTSVIAEWVFFFFATVWPWHFIKASFWSRWLMVQFINDSEMDIISAVKWQNTKAAEEADPLSERQIKGNLGECRQHSREEVIGSFAHWSEKVQQQRWLGLKISFSTTGVASEERGGLCQQTLTHTLHREISQESRLKHLKPFTGFHHSGFGNAANS